MKNLLPQKEKRKKTVRKVLHFLQPYRLHLLFTFTMALITVGLTLYLPILIGQGVDLIGNIGEEGSMDQLLSLSGIMAGVAGGAALTQWLMNLNNNQIVYHVLKDVRKQTFEKIEQLPFSYLDTHSHGDILSRITADAEQFAEGLLMGFSQIFTGVITIGGTLLFMLRINVAVTAVVVFLTPLSLFVARFIARRTFHMFQLQAEARGEQTALVNEMIGNRKVVQVFGKEEAVQKQFDAGNEQLGKYSLRAIFYSSLTNPTTRFINNLVYAGVGLAGALYALSGALTVGQLTVFLSYANQYTKPFNEISEVIAELQNAFACAARVFEFMEEEAEQPDEERAEELEGIKGNVELAHVSFSYRKEQRLIQDFNLKAAPGQRIAIVGPTGCGKTTIINLLMRFYDVNSGRIMVEGKDIRSLTRKSLRGGYGMVLQDTWLRKGTIRDNLILGNREISQEKMVEAAKASHAHSFIKRLPEGYDTQIGEEGGSLSQGQKQLLCITRVMLDLPPMLILDEATSSIDTRTEIKIQHAFALMMKGRTSFIVAHRLSTIRSADRILVMKDGGIIEQGKHEELLEARGFYWKLYHSQFGKGVQAPFPLPAEGM